MTRFAVHDAEATRDAAADWVVRLQSDDLDASTAVAFDAWLAAAPANAAAYDAILAVDDEFTATAPEVEEGLRTRRVRPTVSRRFYFAGGAVAAAAAAAAVLLPPMMTGPAVEAFATARAEHRTVTLADGSRIDLNAGTRLTVSLGRDARRVTLDEGQAVFDVAHDARRPFLIAAGDRTVRVVGTQFDVRRRAGQLSVTVARGLVEVRPSEGETGRAYRLRPGQRLDHTEGAPGAQVAAAAPEEVLGWRSGRLVYRDRPLGEVVADLNQQFATPIRLEDPALAATPISGVFVLDDQAAVIRRLALLVSMNVARSDTGIALRRSSATR